MPFSKFGLSITENRREKIALFVSIISNSNSNQFYKSVHDCCFLSRIMVEEYQLISCEEPQVSFIIKTTMHNTSLHIHADNDNTKKGAEIESN